MKIYKAFLLVSLCLCSFSKGFAQTENITVNNNTIEFAINNKSLSMEIDNNSNELIMTFKELEMIVKKQILLYKPNMKKDTVMVNGKKQVTLTLSLDTLRFKCLLMLNVPAKIIYTIPQYDPNAKAKIGLGLLKKYGTVSQTANNIEVKNIDDANLFASCRQANINPPATNSSNSQAKIQVDLEQIKFIACDTYTIRFKDYIKDLLQNTLDNFSNFEEEPDIPRQKAIDRLKKGTTIRYFDDNDLAAAQEIYKILHTQFGNTSSNEQIHIENMQPYFKKKIPKYIEIWVK